MSRNREVLEILTGATALAVLVGFFVLTYARGLGDRAGGYQIQATFKNVDGLGIGSDVRLAGILVGTVSTEEFDSATNQATVTMTIDGSVELPTDSAALIISDGLLGSKFVKLEPGGEEEYLEDGDQLEFVQNSIILEDVLEKLIKEVEASRAAKREQEKTAKEATDPVAPVEASEEGATAPAE